LYSCALHQIDSRVDIIIVDDNETFIENISFFIEKKLKHNIIATFTDSKKFLNSFYNYRPDVILMDISMPNIDGYMAAKVLSWEDANLKLVAVTMFNNKAYLQRLVEVGFKGCVFKSDIFNELPKALNEVMNGGFYWPEAISV
jgi:DNA-binding NarL/FixJ family response regulator